MFQVSLSRTVAVALASSLLLVAASPIAMGYPILQLYLEGGTYDTSTESWYLAPPDSSVGKPFRLWVIGNTSWMGTIHEVRLSMAYSPDYRTYDTYGNISRDLVLRIHQHLAFLSCSYQTARSTRHPPWAMESRFRSTASLVPTPFGKSGCSEISRYKIRPSAILLAVCLRRTLTRWVRSMFMRFPSRSAMVLLPMACGSTLTRTTM